MACSGSSVCKSLLKINRDAFRVPVRFSNRINVQKPRPPHYERQKIEALTRPKYFEKGERESWFTPHASQCMKDEKQFSQQEEAENKYERLLAKELRTMFCNSKLIAFFHANPIKFDDRFEVEVKLNKEGMVLKKFGKHTVNMALEGTRYMPVMTLFVNHTDMVFCSEPKVDKLLKIASKMHHHVLLAAIVEDRLLSVSQLKTLSQVKDLTTARAQLVAVLNAAQSHLVSGLSYHQSSIAAGLQQLAQAGQSSQSDDVSDQTQPSPGKQ